MERIKTRYVLEGPGIESLPIPVAEHSKAKDCGHSLAGIVGSNPAGAWIFVFCRAVRTKDTNQVNQDKELRINKKTEQNKIAPVQTDGGAHSACYTVHIRSLSPG
jgi:hypothetical protein